MEVNDTLKDIDRWRKNNKLSVFVGSGDYSTLVDHSFRLG